MTNLSDAEIDALQASNLSRDTPFAICHVTHTQFSIARYYGGLKFNGKPYTYFEDGDELIRDDVLSFIKKRRKSKRKPTRKDSPDGTVPPSS